MACNKFVINKRILETRKETEELREQLQNLRDSGSNFSPVYSKVVDRSDFDKENGEESHSVKRLLQPSEPSTSKILTNTKQIGKKAQQTSKKDSTKEGVGLNVSKAPGKKHREKYWEELKFENIEQTNKAEKKQKLLELHKKAIDIVTKNVQAKRERSKSRDRTNPESNLNITKRIRSTSQEKKIVGCSRSRSAEDKRGISVDRSNNLFETVKQKNPNLLYPPLPDYMVRGRERKSKPEVLSQRPNSELFNPNINSVDRSESDLDVKQKPLKPINLFNPSHTNSEYFTDRTENSNKNIETGKGNCNMSLQSHPKFEAQPTYQETNYQKSDQLAWTTGSASLQEEKKMRTNVEQKEEPLHAYPANYIRSVKQKLQHAVRTHKPSEFKVTSSFAKETAQMKNPENAKTREEISGILHQITEPSKISVPLHKDLNFDPKILEHRELKVPETVSELKISKNVSSERGTWLMNAKSVNRNITSGLNIEVVSNIKLSPHAVKNAVTTVKTEDGQYSSEIRLTNSKLPSSKSKMRDVVNTRTEVRKPSSQNICTFENEYTLDLSFESDLCRSRESIIARNSPTYNKVAIPSPNASFEKYLTDTKETPYSKNQPAYIPENACDSIPGRSASRISKRETTQKSTLKKTSTRENEVACDKKKLANINISNSNVGTCSTNANRSDSETSNKDVNESRIDLSNAGSGHYTSLYTEYHPTASDADRMSKADCNLQLDLQNVNTRRGSGISSEIDKSLEVLPQKVSSFGKNEEVKGKREDKNKSMLAKNISLRSDWNLISEELHNANEVHSKFEAEIDLLNDFNDSLLQFTAIEKALELLESKNNNKTDNKKFQDRDTQTSRTNLSPMKIVEDTHIASTKGELPSINYSRGSGTDAGVSGINLDSILTQLERNTSLISTGLEISSLIKSTSTSARSNSDLYNFENLNCNNFAGMSLRMFEQLIKDEDVRLENLKTILKIREKALLDRTKGELAWLEIQRKHLRETGKLQEASLIKSKQKGILVNHQKEKHEMQRLKQMEKTASLERKIILKEQSNLIKHRLCTDDMLSKMKVNMPRERRLSGPLKVIQSQESIKSETSISRKSVNDKDVYSITSHTHSVVSKVSEISVHEPRSREAQSEWDAMDLTSKFTSEAYSVPISQMKQVLLMRETALQKRRKAAEELLHWHKMLLEEERRIIELEMTASAIISHKGCKDRKFVEDKMYPMLPTAQTTFDKSMKECTSKPKETPGKADSAIISDPTELRIRESNPKTIRYEEEMSRNVTKSEDVAQHHKQSPFRNEITPIAVLDNHTTDSNRELVSNIVKGYIDIVDQNLNQLIDDFNKIQEDIFSLSRRQSLNTTQSRVHEQDVPILVTEPNTSLMEIEEIPRGEKLGLMSTSDDKISISAKNAYILKGVKDNNDNEEVLVGSTTAKDRSNKSSSLEEETKSEEMRSSKDERILSVLSITEDRTTNAVSSNRNYPIKGQHQVTYEESDRLGNSLEKFEDKVIIDTSAVKNSTILEELQEFDETENNVVNGENILQKATQLQDKSSSREENQVSGEGKESPGTEESLLRMPECKINGDASGDMESSQKLLAVKMFKGDESNLSKTEEMFPGLSHTDDRTCINTPKDPSLINVEGQSAADSKSKAILSELEQPEAEVTIKKISKSEGLSNKIVILSDFVLTRGQEFDDVSSNRSQIFSVINKAKEDLEILSQDAGMSTDVASSKESSVLNVEKFTAKDASASNENSLEESLNESGQVIIKSTEDVDYQKNNKKDLCLDEEPKFYNGWQVEIRPRTKIVEINDDENTPTEVVEKVNDDETLEVIEILDETVDLSKEATATSVMFKEAAKTRDPTVEFGGDGDSNDRERTSFTNIFGQRKKSQNLLQEIAIDTEIQKSDKAHHEAPAPVKNEVNFYKEEEQDLISLSTINRFQSCVVIERENKAMPMIKSKSEGSSEDKSPKSSMEEYKISRASKESRLQNLYITTYAVGSARNSPQLELPVEAENVQRKQLTGTDSVTVVPTTDEIEEISKYSAKILHKAYLSHNLHNISISENTLGLIPKNITKECYKFVFDLCKEITKKHYKKFEKEKCPSWLQAAIKPQIAVVKPLDVGDLEKYLIRSLNELFRYPKIEHRESAIISWSRKYRDRIDDVLVMELQAEEAQWQNCDKDELIVMNDVVNGIMNTLLNETGHVFNQILSKRTYLY